MQTTINIDDQLLNDAKHKAAEQGIALASVIENALQESLAKQQADAQMKQAIRLITTSDAGPRPQSPDPFVSGGPVLPYQDLFLDEPNFPDNGPITICP